MKTIRTALCIAVSCGMFIGAVPPAAATVLVVTAEDSEIHVQALEGFKKSVVRNKVSVPIEYINVTVTSPEVVRGIFSNNPPDVIVTLGRKAYRYVRKYAPGTPVVGALVYFDDGEHTAVTTGVSLQIPAAVQVPIVIKSFPKVKKIGTLFTKNTEQQCQQLGSYCIKNGFTFTAMYVESEKDFPAKVQEILPQVDCFIVVPDTSLYFTQSIRYLLLEGLRQKVPVIGLSNYFTKAGAVMSIECDYEEVGIQTSEMLQTVLKGVSVTDMPIAFARKTRYTVNTFAAERIGLSISPETLNNAYKVFGK